MHWHQRDGGDDRKNVVKNTLLQAEEWKKIGCNWPLRRLCGLVRKDCTVTNPYCAECAGRSESREDADSGGSISGIENCGATGGSAFAGERDKVKTEQDRCERVCCERVGWGELHLTPCEWNSI